MKYLRNLKKLAKKCKNINIDAHTIMLDEQFGSDSLRLINMGSGIDGTRFYKFEHQTEEYSTFINFKGFRPFLANRDIYVFSDMQINNHTFFAGGEIDWFSEMQIVGIIKVLAALIHKEKKNIEKNNLKSIRNSFKKLNDSLT